MQTFRYALPASSISFPRVQGQIYVHLGRVAADAASMSPYKGWEQGRHMQRVSSSVWSSPSYPSLLVTFKDVCQCAAPVGASWLTRTFSGGSAKMMVQCTSMLQPSASLRGAVALSFKYGCSFMILFHPLNYAGGFSLLPSHSKTVPHNSRLRFLLLCNDDVKRKLPHCCVFERLWRSLRTRVWFGVDPLPEDAVAISSLMAFFCKHS